MNNIERNTNCRILIEAPLVGSWRSQSLLSNSYGTVLCIEEYHFRDNGTLLWRYRETESNEQNETMRYLLDEKNITMITLNNICVLVDYQVFNNQMTMFFEDTQSNMSFTRVDSDIMQ